MNGIEWWLTLFTGFAAGGTWAYIRERARTDRIIAGKQAQIRDLKRELRELIDERWDEAGAPRDDDR